MNLIKTSFLTSISTVIKIINGFVINKVVAVYVGPAGMAILGQFSNFISIMLNFANGGISLGVVKYTAEYHDNDLKKYKLLSTGFVISFVCALTTSIFLVLFRKYLAGCFLKDVRYSSIILIFGITLTLFVLNNFLASIINGQKEIKKLFIINIASSIASLVLTLGLVIFLRLYGALLSYAIGQSIVFFVTLSLVAKNGWFRWKNFSHGCDGDNLTKLLKYSLMALTSTIGVPVSLILVRNYIGSTLSWPAAGFWQGILRISDYYLTIVTASLGVYYLPKLSEIKGNEGLRKELFHGYKIIMPIVTIMALGVYLVRNLAIRVLFTKEFLPMSGLFGMQLVGDIFKIAGWLLGYLLVAKAMTKIFIITEVVSNVLFVGLSIVFIRMWGLVGVTYSFALTNLLYLIALIFIFRKLLLGEYERPQ